MIWARRTRPTARATALRAATRDDRGSVLALVLVLIVVGALIVIPLMTYTIAVLNANRVEEQKTRNVEAARGGIRVALRDPGKLFGDKKRPNGGCPADADDLRPPGGDSVVPGIEVTITCTPIGELSADEVFGLNVPIGVTQLQIAPKPSGLDRFSGATATSSEPPYPESGDGPDWAWWQTFEWQNPLDPANTKEISLPDLPSFTDELRDATALSMPGFDCAVFLPGRYRDPVVIDGSGPSTNVYFASGVYYFERPVTISGDVDVVIGQGLADFGVRNTCADDTQVGANVAVPAETVYAIEGTTGGATWVFGDQGRLEITDTVGAPSVRFNQRYASETRAAWTNIMSVNGDWSYDNGDRDDDEFEHEDRNGDPTGDHSATNVNFVPRSRVLQLDDNGAVTAVELGEPGAAYVASHPDLTDEARVPDAPTAVVGEARPDLDGDAAILVTFDGVEGDDTNGAIVTEYEAAIVTAARSPRSPSPGLMCSTADDPSGLVPTVEGSEGLDPWGRPHPENADDPDGYACLISPVAAGVSYWATARARNDAGWSDWARPTAVGLSAEPITPPPAPTDVDVAPLDGDSRPSDAAIVSWGAPSSVDGAPIVGYDVEVYRLYEAAAPPATSPPTSPSLPTPVPSSSVPSSSAPPPRPEPVEQAALLDDDGARCSTESSIGEQADGRDREWTPPRNECVLDSLPDLDPSGVDGNRNLGYRVEVSARNAAGRSDAGTFEPFMAVAGPETALSPPPAERIWFPFHDTSIVSIDASGAGSLRVEIPGLVSVPMGTVSISNPDGDEISLTGGLTAGRLDVADSRTPLPYGYVPSVVMQREVRITAVAGNVTSTATVKINSDESWGILRWITQ